MDPDFKSLRSPELPLLPLSSDRANRKRAAPESERQTNVMPHQLSPSPSLSALPDLLQGRGGHYRNSSEVQEKVAQFNGLAKEAAQRRKDNEAALKRAILGREEAEGECKRLRDEHELLRREIEEGRARERRALEKAEALQVSLQLRRRSRRVYENVEKLICSGPLQYENKQATETQTHERTIYEKEVRRSRKEAFKSSSALVACQEELRSARNRYTLMREDMASQRRLRQDKEQETLQAQYQLAGLQEELDVLKGRLDLAEEEKAALKQTLDNGVIAKVASEGLIALPSMPENDEFASPRKRRREDRESLKENVDPQAPLSDELDEELMALKGDLRLEKRLRSKAEEETHFLKMECQFGVCSCRIAEQKGKKYVHDNQFTTMTQEAPVSRSISLQPQSPAVQQVKSEAKSEGSAVTVIHHVGSSSEATGGQEPTIERAPSASTPLHFSPNSGTFSKVLSPTQECQPSLRGGALPDAFPNPSTPEKQTPASPQPVPATTHNPQHLPPETTRLLPNPPPRTISHFTTTRVPLKGDDPVFSPGPNTPGGISREEALERIRARRGRARSFAVGLGGTSGRGSVREDKVGEGRVISAPVGGRR